MKELDVVNIKATILEMKDGMAMVEVTDHGGEAVVIFEIPTRLLALAREQARAA